MIDQAIVQPTPVYSRERIEGRHALGQRRLGICQVKSGLAVGRCGGAVETSGTVPFPVSDIAVEIYPGMHSVRMGCLLECGDIRIIPVQQCVLREGRIQAGGRKCKDAPRRSLEAFGIAVGVAGVEGGRDRFEDLIRINAVQTQFMRSGLKAVI